MSDWILTPEERVERLRELAELRANRSRLHENRAAHPEIDHHRFPDTLARLDRLIAYAERLLDETRKATGPERSDLDGQRALRARGG